MFVSALPDLRTLHPADVPYTLQMWHSHYICALHPTHYRCALHTTHSPYRCALHPTDVPYTRHTHPTDVQCTTPYRCALQMRDTHTTHTPYRCALNPTDVLYRCETLTWGNDELRLRVSCISQLVYLEHRTHTLLLILRLLWRSDQCDDDGTDININQTQYNTVTSSWVFRIKHYSRRSSS